MGLASWLGWRSRGLSGTEWLLLGLIDGCGRRVGLRDATPTSQNWTCSGQPRGLQVDSAKNPGKRVCLGHPGSWAR